MNHLLTLPLPLLIVSAVFRIFPPKKINRFYGYRTKSSMKNQDTWNEANRFAANLMLIISVVYFFFIMLCVIFIQGREMQIWASAVSLFCLVFGVLFITEWRLKKLFDESGKRIENKTA